MITSLANKRTARREILTAGLLSAAACILIQVNVTAQSQAGSIVPVFELASVKPNRSGSANSSASWNPVRISVTNTSLRSLILYPYGIKSYQLSTGPGWAESDRYDISAKAEEHATPEQLRLMLQSLLADRFKLAVHRETKDLPVFALAPGKNGPKLKQAEGSPQTSIVKGRLTGQMSMSSLADALTRLVDRPVVDMTGIKGRFDLALEWAPDESQPAANLDAAVNSSAPETSRPPLFSAIQEQLGLKLAAQRAPVDVLVIDRAERPSEN